MAKEKFYAINAFIGEFRDDKGEVVNKKFDPSLGPQIVPGQTPEHRDLRIRQGLIGTLDKFIERFPNFAHRGPNGVDPKVLAKKGIQVKGIEAAPENK